MLRGQQGSDQADYDRFNWTLEATDGASCRFAYSDAKVSVQKTITAGERPFELDVETTLTNKDDTIKFRIERLASRAVDKNNVDQGFLYKIEEIKDTLDKRLDAAIAPKYDTKIFIGADWDEQKTGPLAMERGDPQALASASPGAGPPARCGTGRRAWRRPW